MSNSSSFECPNCAAKYEVVRVEAPPGPTIDREITCVSCGAPLNGREGQLILKYFLVEGHDGLADAKLHARRSPRNQRKSKASAARSLANQGLATLALVAVMRMSEPNGVRVAEFSPI